MPSALQRFTKYMRRSHRLISFVAVFLSKALLGVLSENQKVNNSGRDDYDADKFFEPLQAACETRQPKLMEIALDGIKYLVGDYCLPSSDAVDIFSRSWLFKRREKDSWSWKDIRRGFC
jgi:hypothetical protein